MLGVVVDMIGGKEDPLEEVSICRARILLRIAAIPYYAMFCDRAHTQAEIIGRKHRSYPQQVEPGCADQQEYSKHDEISSDRAPEIFKRISDAILPVSFLTDALYYSAEVILQDT